MYDLENFTLKDTTECGAALRKMGTDAASMEEVAYRTTKYLYDSLRYGEKNDRACALVQFFFCGGTKVHLLASAGCKPHLNKRAGKNISLPVDFEQLVGQYPWVAQSFSRLGARLGTSLYPESVFVDQKDRSYNAFYIPEAAGDSVSTNKELILANNVKTLLGYGGTMYTGDQFVVVAYSKVALSRQTALAFRTFALNTKLAVLQFDTIDSAELVGQPTALNCEAPGS